MIYVHEACKALLWIPGVQRLLLEEVNPKAGLLDYFDCKVHLVVESR